MTIQEFYIKADGDYSEALAGLGKEERILKYLNRFADSQAAEKIGAALNTKDYETAFREAHNLKGMCLNISLMKLAGQSSDLTESLRNGPTGQESEFFELVECEYARVCSMISEIS